jgi:hypothetical protein
MNNVQKYNNYTLLTSEIMPGREGIKNFDVLRLFTATPA